jgi:hypothetical protein
MINALFAEFGVGLLVSVGSIMIGLWVGDFRTCVGLHYTDLFVRYSQFYYSFLSLTSIQWKAYTYSSRKLTTVKNIVNLSVR